LKTSDNRHQSPII